jgi:TRAP-type C4-dicarboxylate transport system permease small subunit
MRVLGHSMIAGLALLALPASWDYVHFMRREGTPVLGWSFQWVFFPFVLLLLALVWRSTWAVVQALRGHGLEESSATP